MVEVSKICKAAQELDLFSWGAYGTGSMSFVIEIPTESHYQTSANKSQSRAQCHRGTTFLHSQLPQHTTLAILDGDDNNNEAAHNNRLLLRK